MYGMYRLKLECFTLRGRKVVREYHTAARTPREARKFAALKYATIGNVRVQRVLSCRPDFDPAWVVVWGEAYKNCPEKKRIGWKHPAALAVCLGISQDDMVEIEDKRPRKKAVREKLRLIAGPMGRILVRKRLKELGLLRHYDWRGWHY